MKSSTDHSPQSDQRSFLKDSSLLTHVASESHSQEPQNVLQKVEQKIISPTQPVLAQLDNQGGIRIDLSVPASALVLGRLLGKGGFGVVYEGLYQGKPVAIKQLSGHLSTDALVELKREAEIMFQLGFSSEHIVKLIKICLETPYSLVMELMPQGSLYDVLHNGQDFPWQTRYQIAADTAQGLADLHERKILHRDLKSLNILLRNGRAKLADFGLAKIKHETSSQSSVSHGKVGTLLWMAPELFDDEPQMTPASDIYSFGMVLWELLTRKLPYAKWRPEVAGTRIAQGKKEEFPSDSPPELKKIIESCWQSTPTQRPTAIQVLTNLKPLAEQKVSPPDDSDSEIKNLKAQMEQMKLAHERQLAEEKQKIIAQLQLAHEQQLRDTAEEKHRLEAEKHQREKEIERLKQQHQEELKRGQEKIELKPPSPMIATPTKSAPIPAIPPTSQSRQILIPTPKSATSPEQWKLQDQLIDACEQGDEKTVTVLLKQGAKPDMGNVGGAQPLGAAVWGMCPDVVNALLKQAGDAAPMTWDTCEKHNLKYYKEVFIIPKFDPKTYDEWNKLLQKMDFNPFIRAFHLKKVDEQWHDNDSSSWGKLKSFVKRESGECVVVVTGFSSFTVATEEGYEGFRSQIKQSIESAKQLMLKTSPEQLALQDQLIAACKQGYAIEVKALLKRGAQPNMANAQGEQPLGAAVWGMCPDVVNALLKRAGNVASMTWEECEKHNLKYYKEVFIVTKFNPQTFSEWNTSLQKINSNTFARAFHLKKADEQLQNKDTKSWDGLKRFVKSFTEAARIQIVNDLIVIVVKTESGYVNYRTQIKNSIERAKKQPTAGINTLQPSKPKDSFEQSALQDKLIEACEQGDAKRVRSLLQQGAQPDIPNRRGTEPLGAAVWGMCPDVVNALLKYTDGVTPMIWEECEEHNLRRYGRVFFITEFKPKTYSDWIYLLHQMASNLFVSAHHLKKEKEHRSYISSWKDLETDVREGLNRGLWLSENVAYRTEEGYVGYRSQIKQGIEAAKMPLPQKADPERLPFLQDRLIAVCKQGNAKEARLLLQRGAQPNITNAKSEHPLGAAVWGMCPDVVNALLKYASGITPMTWKECEQHNLKHYREVFIISEFNPGIYGKWFDFLIKMESNPFILAFHLKEAKEQWGTSNWENLKRFVRSELYYTGVSHPASRGGTTGGVLLQNTENRFVDFRTQIKQDIEAAKQPMVKQVSHSQQLAAPELEAEKQKEIELLKQKNQLESKNDQENLKSQPPSQALESTPSLTPISQTIPQTSMPSPKTVASAEQLKLQDQLIAACKQGDEKTVTALLKQSAKPDMPDAKGEQPLGAAVWGMCPDVVKALLKEAKGIELMTWEECEKHNQKFYQEVFIIPKFDLRTFGEWNALLQYMDPYPFIRAFHLKKVDEQWHDSTTSGWENLKAWVTWRPSGSRNWKEVQLVASETEKGYVGFRSQIKQEVESASRSKILSNSSNSSTEALSSTQAMSLVENKPLPSEIKLSPIAKTTNESSSTPALPSASQSSQTLMHSPKKPMKQQSQWESDSENKTCLLM